MAAFRETYLRSYKDFTVNIQAATIGGANGIGIANVGVVIPQNYLMRILRASAFSNSSGTPTFEIFADNSAKAWQAAQWAPDRTRRVHYTANGKNDPGDFNQPPMIDEGEIATVYWSGGSNGDVCQASFLLAMFQKDPVLTTRDHRGLKHQEELEAMEAAMFPPIPEANALTGSLENPSGLGVSTFSPWSTVDPDDTSANPAEYTEGFPVQIGGNDIGAPHQGAPFRGRVLPDHTRDEKGGLE